MKIPNYLLTRKYAFVIVLAIFVQVVNKNQDRYMLGIFENVLQDGILLARG